MQQISQDLVDKLVLCADLLDYPDNHYIDKLQQLSILTGDEICKMSSTSQEKLEAEHLRLFSMEATANKTVPLASWWLEGISYGSSMGKIKTFYLESGYEIDYSLYKSPDHVVMMLRFISILLEDGLIERAKAFSRFLTWLNDFEKSLESTSVLYSFPMATKHAIEIINILNTED